MHDGPATMPARQMLNHSNCLLVDLIRLIGLCRTLGARLRGGGGRRTLLDVDLHITLKVVDVLVLRASANERADCVRRRAHGHAARYDVCEDGAGPVSYTHMTL